MSFTEEQYNGGSVYKNTALVSYYVKFGHASLIHLDDTSKLGTQRVYLPTEAEVAHLAEGGPVYTVFPKWSTAIFNQVRIYEQPSTLLATLSSGQVCDIYRKAGGWEVVVRTNLAASYGEGVFDDSQPSSNPPTYTPFCIFGDPCTELAPQPLDGNGGRATVVAPFFEDPNDMIRAQYRYPIRAADRIMPETIYVRFFRDNLRNDPNHAAGVTLGSEFFNALDGDSLWELPYDALVSHHGASRHWFHIRAVYASGGGTHSWDMPNPWNIRRHVWENTKTYTDGTGVERTITVRFVMEHGITSEPGPTGETGGSNSISEGPWGAVFHLLVFVNEIEPNFADSDTFTPAGASAPISFTKDDPCVWGGNILGETDDERFCHPQLALAASLPMSFHDPLNSNWIPIGDEDREYCYRVPYGAPWGNPTTTGAYGAVSSFNGVNGNIVFGKRVSTSQPWGAMTMGGGFPESSFVEWLCFENGKGVGRTALTPFYPGWDEDDGGLTLGQSGFSGIIYICDGPPNPNFEDENGDTIQPQVNACQGHYVERMEGIGGSYKVFLNSNAAVVWEGLTVGGCCTLLTGSTPSALATDYCITANTVYGDWNGSTCDIQDNDECYRSRSFRTSAHPEVHDVDYQMESNQNLKLVDWRELFVDGDNVYHDYTYDDTTASTDLDNVRGTATYSAAYIEFTALAGVGAIQGATFWSVAAYLFYDGTVSGTFKIVSGSERKHMLLMGSFSGSQFTGYSLEYDPGAGTLTVSRWDADVEVELSSDTLATPPTGSYDVEVTFKKGGAVFTATWDLPSTAESGTSTVHDCTYDNIEEFGFGSSDTLAGARCALLAVDDDTTDYQTVRVEQGHNYVQLVFPQAARKSYNACNSVLSNCGPPHNCNCFSRGETLFLQDGTTAFETLLSTDNPTLKGSGCPCICGDDNGSANNQIPPCLDCPTEYIALELSLPEGGYYEEGNLEGRATESSKTLCPGWDYWLWVQAF